MGFSSWTTQYRSMPTFPTPGILLTQGTEPGLLHLPKLAGRCLPLRHQGSPASIYCICNLCQPLCSLLCLHYSFSPRQVLLLFAFNIRQLRPRRAKQFSSFSQAQEIEERKTLKQPRFRSLSSQLLLYFFLSLLMLQSPL